MLIQVPEKRVIGRDPAIRDLIKHFDEEGRINNLGALTRKELSVIANETRKCRQDFSYASRNYFWIIDKKRNDYLFTLWESQELILDEMRKLRDRGLAQKLIILKARQLGCSTLIEALIAWRTMFFTNTNAIVVSAEPDHAAYLFAIMLHIYDQMPWWLKPDISSRKQEDGLLFDNPNPEERRLSPGLKSMISVQAATQMSGIGQGRTINAAHVSEYCDMDQDKAQEMIEGDLGNALADGPQTFAILESTGKGAGSYSHRLWRTNVELRENADWTPIFLPWFFDKKHVMAPDKGWRTAKPEQDMALKVASEWVRCDNVQCGAWREKFDRSVSIEGIDCPVCQLGSLKTFYLGDEQLRWMEYKRKNAEKDIKSMKTLREEQATTAEEAWQISGYSVFPFEVQEWVNLCVKNPIAEGNLDLNGQFHGVKKHATEDANATCWCEGCTADHTSDPAPLRIWEWAIPGYDYVIGADVSEGLGGESDYSVGVINRVGKAPNPDVQVGVYRSNTIDPISFAKPLTQMGMMYNEGMLSIEYNKFDSCANTARFQLQYPNLFQWKHLDSTSPRASKIHWYTTMTTKPRLWQTMVKFLRERLYIIQDSVTANEMKTFQKDDFDDRSGSAGFGFYDDALITSMIALYTAHETDFDENLGYIPIRKTREEVRGAFPWEMTCTRCGHTWGSGNPNGEWNCPNKDCGCRIHRAVRTTVAETSAPIAKWEEMAVTSGGGMAENGEIDYDYL